MSILSSGYMDTLGPEGPILRYKHRLRSPSPVPSPEPQLPPPLLRTAARADARSSNQFTFNIQDPKKAANKLANEGPATMIVRPYFTPAQYAAMGDFLVKAPNVIAEKEQAKKLGKTANISAKRANVDPWSFRPLPPPSARPGAKAPASKRIMRVYEESDSASGASAIFQPRKGTGEKPKETATARKSRSQDREQTRRSNAPSPPSQHDSDPGLLCMFNDDALAEDDDSSELKEVQVARAEALSSGEKKEKKQLREEAKAAKAKAAASASAATAAASPKSKKESSQLRNEIQSVVSKVNGWEMDPASKPGSRTSSKSHSSITVGNNGSAWGDAEMGRIFEEPAKTTSHLSKGSHRSRSSKARTNIALDAGGNSLWGGGSQHDNRSARSGHLGDAWAAAGAKHESNSGGSRRSGSRKRGSRHESATMSGALAPIPEHKEVTASMSSTPMPGGWGEEQVWEQPGSQRSRRTPSSQSSGNSAQIEEAALQDNASAPLSHLSHHKSSSHRSHGSRRSHAEPAVPAWEYAAPLPPSHRSSERSSRHSHQIEVPVSPVKTSPVTYHPPTVAAVPEEWTPEKPPPSHISSSHRTKSSFEQAINNAGYDQGSYRRHRSSRSTRENAPAQIPAKQGDYNVDDVAVPRSLRSENTEKVNEWFRHVPVPSVISKISKENTKKHGEEGSAWSRVSRMNNEGERGVGGAWENGDVPRDPSVGTGYGKKSSRHGDVEDAEDWEKRLSSGSSRYGIPRSAKKAPNRTSQAADGSVDWEKRTSSGSSTKADIGVKQPSVRSRSQVTIRIRRSSQHGWEEAAQVGQAEEVGGGGW